MAKINEGTDNWRPFVKSLSPFFCPNGRSHRATHKKRIYQYKCINSDFFVSLLYFYAPLLCKGVIKSGGVAPAIILFSLFSKRKIRQKLWEITPRAQQQEYIFGQGCQILDSNKIQPASGLMLLLYQQYLNHKVQKQRKISRRAIKWSPWFFFPRLLKGACLAVSKSGFKKLVKKLLAKVYIKIWKRSKSWLLATLLLPAFAQPAGAAGVWVWVTQMGWRRVRKKWFPDTHATNHRGTRKDLFFFF